MYMIEITEDKVCSLYENIEKGLKHLGKAMQCIEEYKSESHGRKGHREYDDEDNWEEDDRYSRSKSKGRYSRY